MGETQYKADSVTGDLVKMTPDELEAAICGH